MASKNIEATTRPMPVVIIQRFGLRLVCDRSAEEEATPKNREQAISSPFYTFVTHGSNHDKRLSQTIGPRFTGFAFASRSDATSSTADCALRFFPLFKERIVG
jgi:hypothetical protein